MTSCVIQSMFLAIHNSMLLSAFLQANLQCFVGFRLLLMVIPRLDSSGTTCVGSPCVLVVCIDTISGPHVHDYFIKVGRHLFFSHC